jgi:ABC-2 type transport system permease protein
MIFLSVWLKMPIQTNFKPAAMNKILLIIQREFLTRIRKKSFILMTVLGPILFGSLMVVPILMATMEDKEVKTIMVSDSSRIFMNVLPESDFIKFTYAENTPLDSLKSRLARGEFYGLLFIPHNILASEEVLFFSVKQPAMATRMFISNSLKNMLQDIKLIKHNIAPEVLKSIHTEINVSEVRVSEDGAEKKSSSDINSMVGYAAGFLIYFFVFLYGAQVMRGVIEEKTNRIVEVVISSVKPFQLMMGKIIGIAFVGLLQFVLWVVLSIFVVQFAQGMIAPELTKSPTDQALSQSIMDPGTTAAPMNTQVQPATGGSAGMATEFFKYVHNSSRMLYILGTFIFFFIGGYLLYAAMFAAIGSAVDNETDTQQFMLPVTIPLILAIFVMIKAMQDPDSSMVFWFSMIPFTSPVVMMTRIPFGVPPWQLITSMVILVLTFIFMTWFAAKIYRTGILMYGKKASWGEIWKWLKYSD